ncbi:MAG: hypothetical protein KAV87_29490 [Desulfobacteraceae bacterium]|nr:hypothetical protein [Desulfobacteraceae bacterium]
MNEEGNTAPEYNNWRDIIRWHGLFVLVGYKLIRLLRWTTPIRLWAKLSKFPYLKNYAWDGKYKKSKPWWQDVGIIIHIALVYLLVKISFGPDACLSWFAKIGAWYLLVDIIGYLAGVLWFDDLTPETVLKRKVWSHRRIFFQAIVNFGESIALFAILYRTDDSMIFWALFKQSFEIAATLSFPEYILNNHSFWLVASQILVSLFFLIIVISVIASIGYARPEIGRTFDKK